MVVGPSSNDPSKNEKKIGPPLVKKVKKFFDPRGVLTPPPGSPGPQEATFQISAQYLKKWPFCTYIYMNSDIRTGPFKIEYFWRQN